MTARDTADGIVVLRVVRPAGAILTKKLRLTGTGWQVFGAYDKAFRVRGKEQPVASSDDLFAVLREAAPDPKLCVIRGGIRAEYEAAALAPGGILRRLYDRAGAPATLEERARRWVALDLDSFALPPFVDPIRDVDHVIDAALDLLPAEFQDASFFWQLTSGHGIKPGGRARLWFWLSRPTTNRELKRWLAGVAVDHKVFGANQVIYTAAPLLPAGVADLLPVRSGVRAGGVDEVQVPDADALGKAWAGQGDGGGVSAGFVADSVDDALDRMGDPPAYPGGGGFYAPVMAAVAAAFRADGVDVDQGALLAAIDAALDQRGHTRDGGYIETRKRDARSLLRWHMDRAAEAEAAAPAGPHYRRPTMEGTAASRRLHRIVDGLLARVEKHLDARDWIKAKAAELLAATDPAVIEATRVRVLDQLLDAGLSHQAANAKAETIALSAAKAAATRKAKRAAIAVFGARAASGAMPRIQVKGAAGLGKTEAFIKAYLRRPGLWKRHISVFCRDLSLAAGFAATVATVMEELALPLDGIRPRVQVIKGRQTEGMCHDDRIRAVNAAVEKKVHSVFRACCHQPAREDVPESFCSFYAWCLEKAYVSQFQDPTPALRVMAHARMTLNEAEELKLPKADFVIVDETAVSAFVTHANVDPAALIERANYAAAEGQGQEIIQEAMDLGAAVRELVADPNMLKGLADRGYTPELFRAAADAAARAADAAAPKLWPAMDPAEAVRRCAAVKGKHPGKAIASLFGQVARDLETKRRVSNGIEWDPNHKATAEDGGKVVHPLIWVHGLRDAVQVPKDTALLLLDADARLAINRRLFGDDLRGVTVPAARRARVIQVSDYAVIKGSIIDNVSLPNNQTKAGKLRARIAAMVQREVARDGGQQVLIVTPRKVRLALTGEADTKDLPPATVWLGADMTHYGRHLGENRWAHFDTVIVLGREQLPPIEAERLARAIYADAPDVELNLPGKLSEELRRHDMRSGTGKAVKVQVHPDKRVQELLEQSRENAMGQALDRLRLIYRTPDRPARVLVVSNLPVPGLVVDQLLTLDDMLEGGTVWERALARMPDGVLPVAVKWLRANMDDLFTSERTAKRYVQLLIGPSGNRDTYCQVALLHLAGSTRPTRALIRHGVPDARAQLSRLLGADVVEFKMLGDPPAADLAPVAEPVIDLPLATPPAALPAAVAVSRAGARAADNALPAADLGPVAEPAALPVTDAVLTTEPLSKAAYEALPETIPGLSAATVYRRGVLEPPPADMLTVRGRDHAPVARLEVPRMGGFWCATAVSPWGYDVPLVMPLPPFSAVIKRGSDLSPGFASAGGGYRFLAMK